MSNRSDPMEIWRVNEDAQTAYEFGEILLSNDSVGVENLTKINDYEYEFMHSIGVDIYRKTKIKKESPIPIVNFTPSGFAPDYFSFGGIDFCSERLRDALAQPPDVIDYSPVDFRCSNAKAKAQAYQRMRIIAVQPAMDMQRSIYEMDEAVHPDTGELIVTLGDIEKLVLQENFEPQSEIFCVEESLIDVLATDALAERVLKADCTGLEFQHLDTPDFHVDMLITIRTKHGISRRG